MNRGWFPYLAVFLLLGLLAVLATLQYQWLGQISDAEGIRLRQRLKDDTNRFAQEFNREIQKAYFSFQIDAPEIEKGDFRGLQKRYLFWAQEALDPRLIKDIYLVLESDPQALKRFDKQNATFEKVGWPDGLAGIRKVLKHDSKPNGVVNDVLLTPISKHDSEMTRVVLTRQDGKPDSINQERKFSVPVKYGNLIIHLDRDVMLTSILPGLTKKYFSKDGGGSFEISISGKDGSPVFATHEEHFKTGDAGSGLYSLAVNDFSFFSRDVGKQVIDKQLTSKSRVVFTESFTGKSITDKDVNVEIHGTEDAGSGMAVLEGSTIHPESQWQMFVRHRSGSVDQFIAQTRYRNLGISFGILGVLAAGMILIVISSQRARALANRQLEFVSSVSHEFRTPLAVIYSAGENISDGVIGGTQKLADYGNLIKREGRKLSAMVEQILEYAGANSANRKYEFKIIEVEPLITTLLDEYRPLIEEEGFELERDIAPGLPPISADPGALQRALQNLIANSLKYSDGEKWICVSARNGGGKVAISVKDRGIGISNEDQKHIFEPFFRSRSVVDEQISGNGLGLSLVKQIAEAHGGTVEVSSEPGEGTEFVIRIPTANPKSI